MQFLLVLLLVICIGFVAVDAQFGMYGNGMYGGGYGGYGGGGYRRRMMMRNGMYGMNPMMGMMGMMG